MGPYQVLPLRIKADMGVMELKGNYTFPKSPELEPHHQMQFIVIS